MALLVVNRRILAFGALAGLIAGGIIGVLNATLMQIYSGPLSEQYLNDLLDTGAFDEDDYNSLLKSISLVDNTLVPLGAGIVAGAILSLVYAALKQKLPANEPFTMAILISVALWFILSVIPTLKYPADAEATYDPSKGLTYFLLLGSYTAVSAIASAVAAIVFSRTRRSNKWFGAAALYLGAIAAASFAFPDIQHDESLFPLQILVPWRAAVAAEMTLFWITLGIGFGLLVRSDKKTIAASRPG